VGFPTRYLDRGWSRSMKALPQLKHRKLRSKVSPREGTALTDGLFMSSRDGLTFYIWPESFIRPGPQRIGSWFYGDHNLNWGVLETPSILDAQRIVALRYRIHSEQDGRWLLAPLLATD